VAVWTISAQEGAGGDQIAARLAAAAGVPLLERNELVAIAHEIDPEHLEAEDFDEIEKRFGGRFSGLAFNMAITTGQGSTAALQELKFRHKLPELARSILNEAARQPCVIVAVGAFAALPDHPKAIHVRLRAPLACRIAAYQRERLVDRECAEKMVKHDDRAQHAWVHSLFHVDIDDSRMFALVLDTSRFNPDRLIDVLLAAGGVQAGLLPT
jgi:cytidylate kinase